MNSNRRHALLTNIPKLPAYLLACDFITIGAQTYIDTGMPLYNTYAWELTYIPTASTGSINTGSTGSGVLQTVAGGYERAHTYTSNQNFNPLHANYMVMQAANGTEYTPVNDFTKTRNLGHIWKITFHPDYLKAQDVTTQHTETYSDASYKRTHSLTLSPWIGKRHRTSGDDTNADYGTKIIRSRIIDTSTGTIIQDLIPISNLNLTTNRIGMYDLIHNRFYGNLSTGRFGYRITSTQTEYDPI